MPCFEHNSIMHFESMCSEGLIPGTQQLNLHSAVHVFLVPELLWKTKLQ